MSYKNACELSVQVNGRSVKEYSHNGVTYIEGKQGSRYSLKLKNNTAIRKLVIISVDGIDVYKGGSADEADSGYIINGWSAIEIRGYRVDDGNVAEFVFSDKNQSYAKAVTKNTANSGVIGVRFFDEKEKPYVPPVVIHEDHHHYYPYPQPYPGLSNISTWPSPYQPTWISTTPNTGYCGGGGTTTSAGTEMSFTCNLTAAPPVQTTIPDFNLGTGWGDKVADSVITVPFERGSLVAEMEIYYATRKALEKIGISFDTRKQVYEPSLPKAFGSSSYCKPPQGWNK